MAVTRHFLHSARRLSIVQTAGLILLCGCRIAQAAYLVPTLSPPQSATASGGLTVLFSARNKDGSPAELSPTDLEVRIDGKPSAVTAVRRLPRPPLQYCLLFDSSGSQKAAFQQERDQATQFLSRIPQAGRDYGRFVAFNDELYVDAEGTDPQKLIKALANETPRGGTALYDAMVACSNRMLKDAPEAALRLIVILSDGEDNSSHLNRDATERTLVMAGVKVYTIGRVEAPRAAAALKQFAEATGGRNYSAWKKDELEKLIADISGELDSLYSVTLAPAKPLPGDRSYKIDVKCNRKNISITAPRQYFVPLP
jgi:VWFA-related protein